MDKILANNSINLLYYSAKYIKLILSYFNQKLSSVCISCIIRVLSIANYMSIMINIRYNQIR